MGTTCSRMKRERARASLWLLLLLVLVWRILMRLILLRLILLLLLRRRRLLLRRGMRIASVEARTQDFDLCCKLCFREGAHQSTEVATTDTGAAHATYHPTTHAHTHAIAIAIAIGIGIAIAHARAKAQPPTQSGSA